MGKSYIFQLKRRIEKALMANCPLETRWMFLGEIRNAANTGMIPMVQADELEEMLGIDIRSDRAILEFYLFGERKS